VVQIAELFRKHVAKGGYFLVGERVQHLRQPFGTPVGNLGRGHELGYSRGRAILWEQMRGPLIPDLRRPLFS
jgi:hypothetical protein